MALHIGVDVGGTFTDAVAIRDTGTVRGKALSTADVTSGIMSALTVLQESLSLTSDEFFSEISRFVLGNTIVTNAIDEHRYATVGLLTTAGFKDTLRIARSARGEERNPHDLRPPPTVVEQNRIFEVPERVDAAGTIVVPLDIDATRSCIRELIDDGVEAIAVCLLWSFRNNAHERTIRDLINELSPGLPVTLSSELSPVYREYERMVTTVLDAAVKPLVANHFGELERRLRDAGLQVRPQIMQVHGGFLSIKETSKAPINMFNSGPVGGVTGARLLGEKLGHRRILTADMGGTSLDAAAVVDGELRVLPRARIGEFPTSLTAVDIESIGAGGGSIGWIDQRGLLRVGPRSAGSRPGPVCYGNGGTAPTITDATLEMGLINPEYYLGGEMRLDSAASAAALAELGAAIGLDSARTAHGMYRLAAHQMANAIRKITINRGLDPRSFSMINFGGAMGLFAAQVAQEVGIGQIVVPANAAVFSAWGLIHADAVYTEVRTSPWNFHSPAVDLEGAFVDLEVGANRWFDEEGVAAVDRVLVREADMKFAGQIFEVTTKLPAGPLTEESKDRLRRQFIEDYEVEYGTGTAWTESEIMLINIRIRALARSTSIEQATDRPLLITADSHPYHRNVLDPATGKSATIPVYRGFAAVREATGPCLLEEVDTTVYVPVGAVARMLDQGDVVVTLDEQPTN